MTLRGSPARRPVPLRAVAGRPSPEALARMDWRWHFATLGWAPHRLGFFLAMVVLVASGLWWAGVQWGRVRPVYTLPAALPSSITHAVVMTFGFMPLFFSGFLFTAGPKWLRVEPWPVPALRTPLVLQAAGWIAWLAGSLWSEVLAQVGCVAAAAGLAWMTVLYWRLVWRSRADDQLHARLAGAACVLGSASLAALGASLVAGQLAWVRAWTLTGLWGFVVVVYLAVAHRMIPFFTSDALPGMRAWRPLWELRLMVAAALFEAAATWMELLVLPPDAAAVWALVRGMLELAVGGVLLWMAWAWGRVKSLENRLLAMLHLGLFWLGAAFVLGGAAQWWGWWQGAPALGLVMLHALSMGCLASLMLAMVSRVSCGHGGRPYVADRPLWLFFCVLQGAVVVRIGAAAVPAWTPWLLPLAATLWAATMAAWGLRLGNWYGRPRADGRPG